MPKRFRLAILAGAHRLRAIALAVAFACVVAVVLTPAVALANNPAVNFPDPALNTAVRSAIGIPTGQIYA